MAADEDPNHPSVTTWSDTLLVVANALAAFDSAEVKPKNAQDRARVASATQDFWTAVHRAVGQCQSILGG